MKLRPTQLIVFLSLSLFVFSATSFADRSHDRTQTGHNINVGPDEEFTDATCFGCSIWVRGHVSGDVTTFGGSITIEDGGQVDGDATVFAGDIRLDKEVKVSGDITVFGGQIRRDLASSVGGDVTSMGGPGWFLVILVAPFLIFALFVGGIIWLVRRLLRPAEPLTA